MSNSLGLQLGDVVRLMSGSPDMTVEALPDAIDTTKVKCVWFEGKTKHSGVFEIETLKKADLAAEAAASAAASKAAHAKKMQELGLDKSF